MTRQVFTRNLSVARLLTSVTALTVAFVVAAGAWAIAAPDSVVYPRQVIPLTFSHVAHLERDAALTCESCHTQAAGSRSSLDVLTPREKACSSCHAIDRTRPEGGDDPRAASGACASCHPSYQPGVPVARIQILAPGIKFDHAQHRAAGATCIGCHGDLRAEGVALATVAQLPRMESCLGCHDSLGESKRTCDTCHLAEGGGRVKTNLGAAKLVPRGGFRGDRHDAEFFRTHGTMARADRAYCAACHREDECADCHAGTVKPMAFHAGDYVLVHAIDARRNDPNCSSCHRTQTFCVGCHSRSGVSADGRLSDFRTNAPMRAFHPPGWNLPGGGPGHHGQEARRNLMTCSSCHREDFCAGCHTAERGTPQVSPHPPGWSGSASCEALAAKAGRMCLRCHVEATRPSCDPMTIRGR